MGVAYSEQHCCSCSESAAICQIESERDHLFDGAVETEEQRSGQECPVEILREERGYIGGSSAGLRDVNIFGRILDEQPACLTRGQSKKIVRTRSAPSIVRTQKSLPCLLGNPEPAQSESKAAAVEFWFATPNLPVPPPAPQAATPLTPPPSFREVPPVAAEAAWAASTHVLDEEQLLGAEVESNPKDSEAPSELPSTKKRKSALKKKHAKQDAGRPAKVASELEVVFADEHGNKIPVVITKQPLGVKFGRQFEGGPVRVLKVMPRSYAEALGLEVGWMVVRVAGQDVAKKSFEETQQALSNGMAELTDSSRRGDFSGSTTSTIRSRLTREGTL